jgi:multidrug efflux pump subunit AcrB
MGIAMGLALLLIYFVLVVQIRSLMTPLLIMATIPLAFIGVLIGFAILGVTKGTFFNATSMIGVIALAGIVVKNAIIYLAYLDELKIKGVELTAALMEAGRVRLLPILLTSLTAILGSLTIIADPVWEGLAWSIIFGLSVSTVLTLVIFPLLYMTFESKKWKK